MTATSTTMASTSRWCIDSLLHERTNSTTDVQYVRIEGRFDIISQSYTPPFISHILFNLSFFAFISKINILYSSPTSGTFSILYSYL